MVLVTLKMKLKNFKQDSPRIRFNVDTVKDLGIAAVFEAEIGERFGALDLLEDDSNALTGNMEGNSQRGVWDEKEEEQTLGH